MIMSTCTHLFASGKVMLRENFASQNNVLTMLKQFTPDRF